MTTAAIRIALEPIVYLHCLAFKCQHNLPVSGCCNLKHVGINGKGQCMDYAPPTEEKQEGQG